MRPFGIDDGLKDLPLEFGNVEFRPAALLPPGVDENVDQPLGGVQAAP